MEGRWSGYLRGREGCSAPSPDLVWGRRVGRGRDVQRQQEIRGVREAGSEVFLATRGPWRAVRQ